MKRITLSAVIGLAAAAVKYFLLPTGEPFTNLAEVGFSWLLFGVFFVLGMMLIPKDEKNE